MLLGVLQYHLHPGLHNLSAHPVPKENPLGQRQRSNGEASAAQETKSVTGKHSCTEQPVLDTRHDLTAFKDKISVALH